MRVYVQLRGMRILYHTRTERYEYMSAIHIRIIFFRNSDFHSVFRNDKFDVSSNIQYSTAAGSVC